MKLRQVLPSPQHYIERQRRETEKRDKDQGCYRHALGSRACALGHLYIHVAIIQEVRTGPDVPLVEALMLYSLSLADVHAREAVLSSVVA